MGFWDSLNSALTTASNWIGDKWNRITGKSSAHQIEMEDMQKAGLNPILSSGASSSGSSAGGNLISAGSTGLSSIASVISSAASLTNNKNIDRQTTKQIYNSAGKLMKTAEIYSRRS